MPEGNRERAWRRMVRREFWRMGLPLALLVSAALFGAALLIKPAPPKRLVMAYASDEGGAGWYARRYQAFLKKNGIALDFQQTKGALTNLDLISYPSEASVALVQGGTPPTQGAGVVVSLGALTYIPLWVFYRGEPIEDLHQLAGKRIGAGHPLSGTRALTKALLAVAGADKDSTLLPLEREQGAEQLKKGEIDALFLVAPAESPAIKKLAAAPGIRLLSFSRADAYVRRLRYLQKLLLPRGVFDLAADVPDRDVVLLSPTLNLLARDTLHPALAYLLMRAATEIHGGAGILDDAGEFPAPRESGFPLSDQAKRYYQAGPPFLQRYLPFWAANLVDRLWVMLVPILAVLLPLGRALPALYRWRVRSRVFRWYGRLKQIELKLDEGAPATALGELLARLDEIESAVNRIPTPLAYAENLYFFREHVEVVRRRIARQLSEAHPERLQQ